MTGPTGTPSTSAPARRRRSSRSPRSSRGVSARTSSPRSPTSTAPGTSGIATPTPGSRRSCSGSGRRYRSTPEWMTCSRGSRPRRHPTASRLPARRCSPAGSRGSGSCACVRDVAVSIVNTNNRDLLLACLESLRGADAEVVVLDNASEDGSAAAVHEQFPDVRVIAQEFRAGFGANHNTVIRATDSRYVYVLNEDTTAGDWAFDRIVAYLDAHPRVAALGPRLVYPDGRQQDSAWRFPTPLVSTAGLLTVGKLGVKQSQGERPHGVDWVMGAALVLRRDALDEG